jgi:hypothetical protein
MSSQATDTHATTESLLETVFSVQSMARLYNEDRLPSAVSRERVCRQTDRPLRVAEAGSRG